ncbi:MAG: peptidoglycan DD-metalloendopeptidase family protein [Ilumatobacteraceae bacterium]
MGLSKIAIVGGIGLLAATMLPLTCTPVSKSDADVQLLAAGVCVYGWPSVPRTVATIHAAQPDTPLTPDQWEQWAGDASLDDVALEDATDDQIDEVLTAAVNDILANNDQLLVAVPTWWIFATIPGDNDPSWTAPLEDGTLPADYITNWLNLYAVDPTVIAAAEAAGVQDCASEGRLYQSCVTDDQVDVVLATIRHMESGGNYQAQAANATASGAYQFVDGTWTNYGGYAHAKDAPPDVQDAKAREHVRYIFDTYDTQIATVPVIWYLPAAYGNDELMDTVPDGNRLTPRQYQARWLDRYRIEADAAGVELTACGVTTSNDGTFAFPLPHDAVPAAKLLATHHDYPAIDIGVPVGTPLYAPVTGTVIAVTNTTTTWYEPRGGTCTGGECSKCGIGARIKTSTGWQWSICHMSRNDLTLGQDITAGQPIGLTGNTGHSSGPHLHYGIRNPQGASVCPQPLLTALYNGSALPALTTLPTSGCIL